MFLSILSHIGSKLLALFAVPYKIKFIFWMLVSRPTIRLLQSIQGQTCHEGINHDIVGLCFEVLMRLSYYIHLGFGKKLSPYWVIEPWSFWTCVINSTPRPERKLLFFFNCLTRARSIIFMHKWKKYKYEKRSILL